MTRNRKSCYSGGTHGVPNFKTRDSCSGSAGEKLTLWHLGSKRIWMVDLRIVHEAVKTQTSSLTIRNAWTFENNLSVHSDLATALPGSTTLDFVLDTMNPHH
jgi:hypothetical protein